MSYDDPFGNQFDNADTPEFDHSTRNSGLFFDPTQNYKLTTADIINFVQRPQLNPGGANIYAIATYGTPPFNPIGAAFMVRNMPHPEEPAFSYYNMGDVTTQLGGLVSGTNYSQPLYDPATDTFGGLDTYQDSGT